MARNCQHGERTLNKGEYIPALWNVCQLFHSSLCLASARHFAPKMYVDASTCQARLDLNWKIYVARLEISSLSHFPAVHVFIKNGHLLARQLNVFQPAGENFRKVDKFRGGCNNLPGKVEREKGIRKYDHYRIFIINILENLFRKRCARRCGSFLTN